MTELWLVRHGETDWNRCGRIQGWQDVPLNADGVRQATALAAWLQGIPFHRIIASDLRRAVQTAHILAWACPAPVILCPWIRERRLGTAEGLLRSDIPGQFPDGIPDAESDADMAARLESFLQCVTDLPGERILCVTHGGPLRMMLDLTAGLRLDWIDNTSVTRLRWRDNQWQVLAVNDTRHLQRPDLSASG